MAAVASYHPCKFLIAVIKIELRIRTPIVKLPYGVLVASWLFEIEQSQGVSGIQNIRVAYAAVKIEHVHAQSLGILHLLHCQFLTGSHAVAWPETPGDGCDEHHSLAIEIELPVTILATYFKPSEPEMLPHLIGCCSHGEVIQVRCIH